MLRNTSRSQDMTPAVSSCGSIAAGAAFFPKTTAVGSNAATGDIVVQLAQLRAPQTTYRQDLSIKVRTHSLFNPSARSNHAYWYASAHLVSRQLVVVDERETIHSADLVARLECAVVHVAAGEAHVQGRRAGVSKARRRRRAVQRCRCTMALNK